MKTCFLAWLVIAAAALVGIPTEARAQTPAVSEAASLTPTDLSWWWNYRREVWSRRGSHIMSTSAPFVGRLVITAGDGATQTCSATLVGERHVLTAAHCVCFDAPTHAACAPRLAQVSALFMLPAAGSFASAGAPEVHPNYHRPNTANADELADLALIRLARAPTGVAWAATEGRSFDPSLPHAHVSFGPFSLTESVTYPHDDEPLFYQGTQYLPGFAMTSVLADNRLRSGRPCEIPVSTRPGAPRIVAQNIFCARYSEIADAPESGEQDFLACRGDSGGALVEHLPSGMLRLVGVATFVSNTAGDCQVGARGGATFYVDVSAYKPWIDAIIGPQDPAPNRLCVEMLRGSGAFFTDFADGELSFVSVAVTTHGWGDDVTYPAFSIEAPGSAACTMQSQYGFGSCELQGGRVTVRSPTPGAKTRMVFCYE